MRNEGLRPRAYALVKSFSDGLVWKEEGDAMRMESGDLVAFNDCESMCDALKVGLCLKMILCDVDGNDNMHFVSGKNSLEKNSVLFSKKWKPCLRRAWGDFRCVFIAPACYGVTTKLSRAFVEGPGMKLSIWDWFVQL